METPPIVDTHNIIITICYNYVLRRHTRDELSIHQPSFATNQDIFFFLQALERVWPNADWEVVAPNTGIHLLHLSVSVKIIVLRFSPLFSYLLKETYQALKILCDYDLDGLWHHFARNWELEAFNVYDAREAFEDAKDIWFILLHGAKFLVVRDFYEHYDRLREDDQEEYTEYAETVPRDDPF
ncbi:hypothetical protein FRC02_012058 [Tulasnella sp. 418]|nr:hypothetical protein FRC02_012058 [Tulasnella sp. 418]